MSLAHSISRHPPIFTLVRLLKQILAHLLQTENSRKLGDKRLRWLAYRPTNLPVSYFIPTWMRQFQSKGKMLSNYLHNIQIVDNLQVTYIDNHQVVYVDDRLAMFRRRRCRRYFQTCPDLLEYNRGHEYDAKLNVDFWPSFLFGTGCQYQLRCRGYTIF